MVEPWTPREFDTYLHHVVSLSRDTFTPGKVLVIPRKWWLHPNMTEKLFTGMLSLNKTKQTDIIKTKRKRSVFDNLLGILIFKLIFCTIMILKFLDNHTCSKVFANCADPDQTAPRGEV